MNNGDPFKYLQKFHLSVILSFIVRQIRMTLNDAEFCKVFMIREISAWNVLQNICEHFLIAEGQITILFLYEWRLRWVMRTRTWMWENVTEESLLHNHWDFFLTKFSDMSSTHEKKSLSYSSFYSFWCCFWISTLLGCSLCEPSYVSWLRPCISSPSSVLLLPGIWY